MNRTILLLLSFVLGAFILSGCKDPKGPDPEPDPETAVCLSKNGTANCYIAGAPGEYFFDATVRGNGKTEDAVDAPSIAPVSAALLWQDSPSLVSDVALDGTNVRFTVTGESGNAVIAVYDGDKTILWSWHIWVTDYNPSSSAPKLNGLEWMTRNLGALSDDYDAEGTAKGMAYQWGRKDPFPSGKGWTDNGEVVVYGPDGKQDNDIFANVQVESQTNLQNAIENPTTYYYGTRDAGDDGPYDWYTTDASMMNNKLWERTTDSGKTMYDPCPPGWRVPRNGSWSGMTEANFIFDEAAYGRRHALLGYYPFAGSRGTASGEWSFVGGSGNYWSSSAGDEYYVYILNFLPGFLNTHSNSNRSGGCPVRCVSETAGDPNPDPEPGEEFVMDRVTDASYIHKSGTDGSSNYYIGLANVDFEVVEGEQVPVEPGMIMYFDIYARPSTDKDNAVLPEGTYTLGSELKEGTASTDYTWARVMQEDGEIVYYKPVDGKIKVSYKGSGYSITGTFVIDDEKKITVKYEGDLDFTDRTGENPVMPPIVDPVDATFSQVVATWEYTGKESERYTVRLLDGTLNGEVLTEGYLMTIDLLCSPGSTKDHMVLAEGRYTPSNDYVTPMTFTQGGVADFIGVPVTFGTYIQYVMSEDSYPLTGLIEEGYIDIAKSGDQYEITVDVVTAEGVEVKGVYPMGDVTFIDESPEVPGGDWLSILKEDKDVVFGPDDESTGRVWRYSEGREYEILVDNYTTGEAFQLNFLVDEGADSYFGTYTTPADPDNVAAGEFFPGWLDLSVKRGTWPYLYYDYDDTAYIGAPATEGTIHINDLGDGLVEIVFEMKDDAEPKNTITSRWTGSLKKVNYY